MHQDVEVFEQLNQYCIQKEQNDKFIDYLNCFVKEKDSENCLSEVKIDFDKLKLCTDVADKKFSVTRNLEDKSSWLNSRYPLFDIHKLDNEKYGVGGSPSLIINGEQVESGRDSNSLLTIICSSFDTPPEECQEELSSAGAGASGSCE